LLPTVGRTGVTVHVLEETLNVLVKVHAQNGVDVCKLGKLKKLKYAKPPGSVPYPTRVCWGACPRWSHLASQMAKV
jgi:hypothetical protein